MSSDALISVGAMGLDEFSCPNCSIVIDPDRVRCLTLGCIVRHTLRAERAHRKDLRELSSPRGTTKGGGGASSHIPSSDDMRELFTNSSVYVTALPPVITAIKCTLGELTQRTKLLGKDVHVCVECYERFVDGKEMELQMDREAANMIKRQISESMPKSLQALNARNRHEAFEFNSRNPNRHTDMAFTDTQVRQRTYNRDMELKRRGKESLLESHNADVESLGVDWDVISPTAAREMRRVAGTVVASGRLSPLRPLSGTKGDGEKLPLMVTTAEGTQHMMRTSGGPSPPNTAHSGRLGTGRVIRGQSGLYQQEEHPFLTLLENESQPTAFDVPFEDRLMADLYATMCSGTDFTGAEGAEALQPDHPLYMVYRNGANPLPAPPVERLLLSPPHPLETRGCAESNIRAIPSELKGVEETPVLDSARRVVVGKALKMMGLGELTGDELHLLDGILQDTTIEVPSDEDESDGYGSDYDSEGGSEEEFGRGY